MKAEKEKSTLHRGWAAENRISEVWPDWHEKIAKGVIRILHKNFRCKSGEIDWILEVWNGRKWELVFVEIRSLSLESEHPACWAIESVGPIKRSRIRSAAKYFLKDYYGPAQEIRFDLIALEGQGFTWIPNAW